MVTPSIKLEYNLNKETEKFYSFLHHSQFPQHRNSILKIFPDLDKALKQTGRKEKEIIEDFIVNFRKKYTSKINQSIKISEQKLSKSSEKSLQELSVLMDYQWDDGHTGYIIIPTILPFSPFEDNTFYFSILGEIHDKKQHDIIFVSVHEISHFVLFEILKKIYNKPAHQTMDKVSLYFLKEILAPVLMNQKSLRKIIDINNYLGNPDLHNIFVDYNNNVLQITKFFQQIYENKRYKENKKFNEILRLMINIILSIKDDLNQKNDLWNKYGNSINNNKKAFNQYKKSIKIKPLGVF